MDSLAQNDHTASPYIMTRVEDNQTISSLFVNLIANLYKVSFFSLISLSTVLNVFAVHIYRQIFVFVVS